MRAFGSGPEFLGHKLLMLFFINQAEIAFLAAPLNPSSLSSLNRHRSKRSNNHFTYGTPGAAAAAAAA